MLVVDLMHEFELGVWKSMLIHIIRLLYAAAPGGRMVTEFNARYVIVVYFYSTSQNQGRFRQIPTFGQGTIRRFSDNVSERKKLAARNYEDILQVNLKQPSPIAVLTSASLF
jgi:hypothetical protein